MFARRQFLTAAITLAALPAFAHSYTAGEVEIGHPWSRAAPAGRTGAGYMTLRTTGAADRLLSASSPAAERVELHTHIHEGAVMRMRPVTDIPVTPGETVELKPGGLHLMLVNLTAALQPGARVPITLHFERGGDVTVELAVERAGAAAPAHAH
ncbi:hypothetical protein C8P66_11923 [Humitalea rosea]|uniref:Copper(I)-binding protein n=1 Tax=Humitalea rosea TaxID=990373 RepID=A0A2W7I5H5_9PROT|nr:copper chaperone PCu(A)C [Humitalea rosea]PZW42131.1 hypothetical protein C8P66_11923 [Humitalea rosea]